MEYMQHSSVGGPHHDQALAAAIRALGSPDFPAAFARLARQLLAFDNLILIVYHGEQRPAVLYREFTDPVVYLPMDSEYLGSAYLLDPFYHEHLRGGVEGVRRLVDVAPDHFSRTQYFKAYYEQTTLLDEIAVFAGLGEGMTITACFGRDRSSGVPYSEEDIQAMTACEQILTALLARHWHDYQPAVASSPSVTPLSERLRDELERKQQVRLSPRQAEVALFILRGHSSVSIGLHLDVSPQTVKVFRRQLYARCGISTQAELFAMMMPIFSRLTAGD